MEKVILQNFNNEFLQSEEWRKFQELVGKKTFNISGENFYANIIEHKLPLVGRYFYIPKGPILKAGGSIDDLIDLAKKEKAGWIRIEPGDQKALKTINNKVIKAPHDMQPRETLIVDITKSEEDLLSEMKSKTRYNIRLAEKKGVKIIEEKNIEEFLRLNKIMSERQGIQTHAEDYYRKMFEVIPEDILKLYLAKYKGKIIAANIVIFYKGTATYLHGASDDKYKKLMAPYLLQWRQIQDAKKTGCTKYDFFGVKVKNKNGKSWAGITRFKLGFAPKTSTVEFPGSYDIVICPVKYWAYRIIQKLK